MPYELRCPSCGNVVESPFVRVGAVVACERCGHRYRITDAHVERKTRAARAAGLAGESMMAEHEDAEQSVDQVVRLAADGRVIGLSGLSELMRDEPMPQVASSDDAGEPAQGHRVDAASAGARQGGAGGRAGGQAAREDARRRNARVLYVLVAIVVLTVAAVGGAVWYAMMVGGVGPRVQAPVSPAKPIKTAQPADHRRASSPAPSAVTESTAHAARPPSPPAMLTPGPYADVPLADAKRLPASGWKRIHKHYEMTYRSRGDAWISDEHRVFTASAQEHYTAQAQAQAAGIVTAATLHVVLANTNHQALAQLDAPLSLFGDGRPEPLRVVLPVGMPDGLIPDAHVEIHERMAKGVYLDDPTIEPIFTASTPLLRSAATKGLASAAMVLISARVPPKRMMSHVVFIITALGSDDQVLARWRSDLHQEVVPEEILRFRVATPLENLGDAEVHWELEAAGE